MVVVEERGNPAGLRQAPRERRRTWERGRAAPEHWYGCPHTPHIYIGARERGEAQPWPFLQGRVRLGGVPPPQGTSEVPSPFRTLPFLILWRMGLLGLVPLAHIGQGAHPYRPCGPPGQVAPPGGPPGPFRWSRYNTGNPRNFPGGRNCTSYI